MARVVHFELPAENPERAISFYKAALGWSITKWEGPMDYWLISTGPQDKPGITEPSCEPRGLRPSNVAQST